MDFSSLVRVTGSIRRAVLIRRRLLAALLAAVSVLAVLRVAAPPEPDSVTVLAAASDLPAGSSLGADDVVEQRVQPDRVPEGAITRAQLDGRVLASPVRRGEPLTDARLLAPALLEGYPGLVALPVRIPDPASVDLVRVGDHIDLLATDPAAPGTPAATIASDVAVLALPPGQATGVGTGGTGLGGRLVVLAVPEATARHVAAEAVRSVLTLVLIR